MKNVIIGSIVGIIAAGSASAMDIGYGVGQVDPRLAAAVEAQQVDVYPDAIIRIAEAQKRAANAASTEYYPDAIIRIAEAQKRAEAEEFYVDAVVREAIKQGKAFIGDDGKVYSVGYGEGQVDPSFVR